MIYKVSIIKDDFLENIYRESLDELNAFYGIDWKHYLPRIIVVDDRKTIDFLKGEKTKSWVIGWSESKTIYILNKDNYEDESDHKYDHLRYSAFIKHELSHSFYNVLSKGNCKPIWLNDGVAIYTSGQNKFKKKPVKFKNFLEFHNHGGKEMYAESGFVVQLLVEKYGKQKLLKLISGLDMVKNNNDFSGFFKKIYGFDLNYENFNSLLKIN